MGVGDKCTESKKIQMFTLILELHLDAVVGENQDPTTWT